MRRIGSLIVGLMFVLSCSKEDAIIVSDKNSENQELYSIVEVNSFIENQLKQNGDVDWVHAEAKMLFSAVMHGGEILSIGYGVKGTSFSIGQKSPAVVQSLQNVLKIIEQQEGQVKSTSKIDPDAVLHSLEIQILNLQTVKELQAAEGIRYLDPIGYDKFRKLSQSEEKNFGCHRGNDPINSQDYTTIAPNALQPWNFEIHKIPQAWGLSTGAGITVGIIDTGLSPRQELMNADFNNGDSNGRIVKRFGTYVNSPWLWSNDVDGPNDRCGHGTQMAAVLASPRNDDGLPVGVAYNCDLVVYRGTSDVLLEGYHERKGVSNALIALANRSNVKIISMSIGFIWSIGNIKDAIKYAYSKDKLIIAAGGTSTTFTNGYGIIFPASMDETVAVTGIKDNGYNRCDVCHEGKMDFTITMQRATHTKRNVPIIGFNTGTTTYATGSSIATAMTSGIAALVWARNPNMTRDQVLGKLKKAGEFYPNKDGRFGYGNINALKAVQ